MPKSNTLHCEIIGSGKPLILLHGWGWNSAIWQPIIPQLAESFQLFLIDLPGCGKSPLLSKDYTIEEIATQLFAVVPEQASWLGWSLGGMIAWWIALHYPEKVNRLITVASTPKFVADPNWPGIQPSVLDQFKSALIHDYQQTLNDFLDLQLRGAEKRHELLLGLQTQLLQGPTPAISALLGGLELLKNLDLRPHLTKKICPSIHLFGSHDTLVPKDVTLLLTDHHCETIHRAGHIPFLTHTDIFSKYINSLQ